MAEFRWAAEAVGVLLRLQEEGFGYLAERIIARIEHELASPPRPHRRVRIKVPGTRSVADVQVLFLSRRLPFKVYYRYIPSEDTIDIVAIRHGRQKPLERGF